MAGIPLPTASQTRHGQLVTLAQSGTVKIAMFGASETQGWIMNPPSGAANARQLWDAHFVPLDAGNFGINTEKSGHILGRLRALAGNTPPESELEGYTADIVFLFAGANDIIGPGVNQPDYAAKMDAIVANIAACVDEIHARQAGARCIVWSVPCLPDPIMTENLRRKATYVNDRVKLFAGIEYADLQPAIDANASGLVSEWNAQAVKNAHTLSTFYTLWNSVMLPLCQGSPPPPPTQHACPECGLWHSAPTGKAP